MSRPSLQEGLGMLSGIQGRRENKALWDHINSYEKASNDKAAENKRTLELILQEYATLAQEFKEIQENAVTKQEFEAYKEREKAWNGMDVFYANGLMGEQKKTAAEQRIAARAEGHHAVNESPIVLDRLEDVDAQLVPPALPYKSPFFQSNENRAQDTIVEPSLEQLRAMAGEASPQPSDDEDDNDDGDDNEDEDNYYDDGYDEFWVKKDGPSKQVARNMAHGEGCAKSGEGEGHAVGGARSGEREGHGEGYEGKVRNGVGPDVDKRTATVFAKPSVHGQPSKVPNNNLFDAGKTSHHFLNEGQQKRPHDAMSNVSMRVDEHMAEQERKKANNPPPSKRPRVFDYTPPELVYGHRPQTRSTVPEKPIQPPPPPHKPVPRPDPQIMKSKVKPISMYVDKATFKPIANPGPKLKLPRLMQGKSTPIARYYKEANEAFSTFPHKDENGQEEFVNHFLAGMFARSERNEAIAMLQQNEDSTVKYKKPWIQCQWKNVVKSLLAAKLVTKKDLV